MTAQSAGLEQRARELLAKWRAGIAAAPALDKGLGTSRFEDIAAGMAQCADELEAALAAAPAADGVIVPREIVENYAQSTLIPRHKRICEAALAALPHMQPAGEAVNYARLNAMVKAKDALESARNWHLGDKYRFGDDAERMAWQTQLDLYDGAIAAFTNATPPQPSAEPQQETVTFMIDDVRFNVPARIAQKVAKKLAPHDNLPRQEAQGAVAWYCEWLEDGEYSWTQYHDAFDPLPETWDDPPDRITPLYAATQPAPVDVRVDQLLYALEQRDAEIARLEAKYAALLSAQQFIDTQRKSPQVRQKIIAYQYHNTLTFAEEADDFMQNEGTALVSALDAQQPIADAGDGAMARDAARYRWLRDDGIDALPYTDYGLGPMFPNGESLDAAIDAAIAAQREAGSA